MTGPGGSGGRRVVLHLGMHKTGSTSVQKAFHAYRDDRIEYADLWHPNHSFVLARAFRPLDREGAFRSADPERRRVERDAARGAVARAVRAREGGRAVILSGEALWGFERASAVACGAFLRDQGARIEGLAYIRDPEGFMRSMFQQRVKGSGAGMAIDRMMPPYRYRGESWIAALGAEPQFVAFDRATLAGGDVVLDFAQRLGLSEDWARARLSRENESLTAEATAVLYLYRRRYGRDPAAGPRNRVGRQLVRALRSFGTQRFDFSSELLDRALERRARDIAWMEARLGRSLPSGRIAGAVEFGSLAGILDFAQAQGEALAEHLAARGLIRGDGARTTEAVLAEVAAGPRWRASLAYGLERAVEWAPPLAVKLRAKASRAWRG